ncbi:hypothetical protein TNCV_4719661 [Trichonephila clavipes]|uniref:Uncharacterized protein n=1 Tax=Trichonephila clavipes TaxID=2585209 RepID=A0A8X7BEZ7_TRICX|nr:hypothetical protein TNCV_4719661 [Trichonephila clavipes]
MFFLSWLERIAILAPKNPRGLSAEIAIKAPSQHFSICRFLFRRSQETKHHFLSSFAISDLFCWIPSKGFTKLDTGLRGQCLQDGCRLFA